MPARAAYPTAEPFLPPPEDEAGRRDLDTLRAAAAGCRGCPLYESGTGTVFGAGPAEARLMMVGEQPGDQEDLAGLPFVGPAGQLLDRALAEAGIDRSRVYITNAVKHFKWEPRGKRRLHRKPGIREVRACAPWLRQELAAVRPRVVVPMGATAAQALLGPQFRVTEQRGEVMPFGDGSAEVMATLHPSALLRERDPARREERYATFVADLRRVAPLGG